MSALLDILEQYGFISVCTILLAVFVGSKWCYDSFEWIKGLMENWRAKKNGEEKVKYTIDERLTILEEHDKAQHSDIKELKSILEKMQFQMINDSLAQKRTAILDFADFALNPNRHPSKEKYNDIFKQYEEYEKLLEEHEMTNGQAEISMQLIRESYKERLGNHGFIEDILREEAGNEN